MSILKFATKLNRQNLSRSTSVFQNMRNYSAKSYEFIQVSNPAKGVELITLNRPKALNALCNDLVRELNEELFRADADNAIGSIVLTGSTKAFAAGADIKEMNGHTYASAYSSDMLAFWADIKRVRKPILAAINGYALGGGCELAMATDIMYAGDKAVFGQPEIKLGVLPGGGGSQRMTRYIGKSKAMELCLTGRNLSAQEAEKYGLVAAVFPAETLVDEVVKVAAEIASYSPLAVKAVKEAINESYELSLEAGLRFERRLFHASFATKDQSEGMTAFAEKRKPVWKNE